MINNRLGSLTSISVIIIITLLLTGCPGGGSGGGNGGGATFDIGDHLPFRMVTLDHATGPLAAGSHVPLACILGGSIIGGHGLNCEDPHLHDTINIIDLGGPYMDPDNLNCGHGKVGFASYNNLTYRCALVENASINLVMEEYALFTIAIASFFLPGQTTPAAEVDITSRLDAKGVIPIEEATNPSYDRLQLYTACFRGFNPDTGENEYVHQKTFFDLPVTETLHVKIDCTNYADYQTANQDITLGVEYSAGQFYTGGRSIGAQNLVGNTTTSLSYSVKPSETEKTALVIGYNVSGWDALAYSYNPQVAGAFDTNTSALEQTQDTTINGSNYDGQSDFLGIKVYAKAPGLYQSYYQFPPPVGTANAPKIGNLASLGGIHKIKASFSAIEAITSSEQTASISKYSLNPGMVSYTETRPAYFTRSNANVVNYVSPSFSGFTLNHTYDPGIAGQDRVKTSVRAETVDMAVTPNTRHFWKGDSYSASNDLDMTYPSIYLSSTGTTGLAPTDADLTGLRLIYSNNFTAALRHDLYGAWPLSEKDEEISYTLGYKY